MAEDEEQPSMRYWGSDNEDDGVKTNLAAAFLARINERSRARKEQLASKAKSEVNQNQNKKSKKKKEKNPKIDAQIKKESIDTSLCVNIDAEERSGNDLDRSEEHLHDGKKQRKSKDKTDIQKLSVSMENETKESSLVNGDATEHISTKKKKKLKGVENNDNDIPTKKENIVRHVKQEAESMPMEIESKEISFTEENGGDITVSRKKKKEKRKREESESAADSLVAEYDGDNRVKHKRKEKRRRAESESAADPSVESKKENNAVPSDKSQSQDKEATNVQVNGLNKTKTEKKKEPKDKKGDNKNKEKKMETKSNAGNKKKDDQYEGFTMLKESILTAKTKVERVLPHWMTNPIRIDPDVGADKVSVDAMKGLDPSLKKALSKNKINVFFPVQKYVIPELLSSATSMTMRYRPRDICVSAPTGSGKTLAYALPLIQALANKSVRRIRALVILPVRELAIQVFKIFLAYAGVKDVKVGLACGEDAFAKEQNSLVSYNYAGYKCLVDILVATPGRLSDHLSFTKGFDLSSLRYLILDEADHLLKMDGGTCIERIEQSIKDIVGVPKNSILAIQPPGVFQFPKPGLHRLLFSATLTSDPEQLKVVPLYRPKLFATFSGAGNKAPEIVKYVRPETLTEEYTVIEESVKPLIVYHMIKTRGWSKVLIFTNSIVSTHKLTILLKNMAKDKEVAEFSKSVDKRIRINNVKKFLSGNINILVSSDAMARGLDIPAIDNVICYDVTSPATYLHRIGRTARAGAPGTALTLVTKDKIRLFKNILTSGGEAAKELSIPTEQLECYETMYIDALEQMKSTLMNEQEIERRKIQKANARGKRKVPKGRKAPAPRTHKA